MAITDPQIQKELREWKPRPLAVDKSIDLTWKGLLKVAEELYGKNEADVKALLKSKGHERWLPGKWWDYLAHFRVCWGRTLQEQAEEQRIKELTWLEQGAECVLCTDEHGFEIWEWMGTPEAIAAHWELEDIRRKQKVREARRKTYWRMS